MKKYTTFCVLGLLIFSLFGCSKPKQVAIPENKSIIEENKLTKEGQNEVEKQEVPKILAKYISLDAPKTYLYYEKDIVHPISQKDLDNVPNKEWKEVWKVKGPDQNRVMLLNTQDYKKGELIYLTNSTGVYPDRGTGHMGEVNDENFTDTLLAFDPIKQQIIWRFKIKNLLIKGIALTEKSVFMTSNRATDVQLDIPVNLYSIDKKSGKENWRFDFNGSVSSNPIYIENSIYFYSSGYEGEFLNSVDATNGKLLFSIPLPENVHINTEEYKTKDVYCYGRNLYFKDDWNLGSLIVFNIDLKSFTIIGKEELTFQNYITLPIEYSSPILLFEKLDEKKDKDTEEDIGNVLSMYAYNQETQKAQWKISVDAKKSFSGMPMEPLTDDNHLFMNFQTYIEDDYYNSDSSESFVACFNSKTKEIDWSFSVARYEIQKVILDSGRIYVTIEPLITYNRDYFQYKNAYLLALDANTGKILWKIKKGMWLQGTSQHYLLVGDENNLYAISPD